MRTIGVVTVGRSDYSIYLPVLRRIQEDPNLRLHLIVAGMHLSPEFGLTVSAIEDDGFEIGERVDMTLSSDSPVSVAKSMGLGTIGFAQAYSTFRPDILLVLGDRFEMHSAVVASLPFNIPVAHIHGGELTEGAIDEVMRHSITKMSHIHFVATEAYSRRVIRMGEEPWRVVVSGAPSLDNLCGMAFPSRQELENQYHLELTDQFLLATYHPVTREYDGTEDQVGELLAALEQVDMNVIFTYPNADPQGRIILDNLNRFVEKHKRASLVANLGTKGYFSFMKHAATMVGNSSSGIIEAASLKLPVVNIGDRQLGRIRERNVIDVGSSRTEILAGIEKAVSAQFNASLENLNNPYGDGNASERIVAKLNQLSLDGALLRKRFHEPAK